MVTVALESCCKNGILGTHIQFHVGILCQDNPSNKESQKTCKKYLSQDKVVINQQKNHKLSGWKTATQISPPTFPPPKMPFSFTTRNLSVAFNYMHHIIMQCNARAQLRLSQNSPNPSPSTIFTRCHMWNLQTPQNMENSITSTRSSKTSMWK